MRRLVLVKHSQPLIDPNVPAKEWRLSENGRRRCISLAERLAPYHLAHIITSTEPKAIEIASIVATPLRLRYTSADGLHEHDRSKVPFQSVRQFQESVANFFAQPEKLVFGKETAMQVGSRFSQAVEQVLSSYTQGNLAIVAHGTVISLFIAAHNQSDPLALWQQLSLPSFVVLRLPSYQLVRIVATVEDSGSGEDSGGEVS